MARVIDIFNTSDAGANLWEAFKKDLAAHVDAFKVFCPRCGLSLIHI